MKKRRSRTYLTSKNDDTDSFLCLITNKNDNTDVRMSTPFRCLVLALVVACLMQATGASYSDAAPVCPNNCIFLNGSGIAACFALLDVDEGPVNARVASQKCENGFAFADFVKVQSKVNFSKR